MGIPRKSSITNKLTTLLKAAELPQPKRAQGNDIDAVVPGEFLSTRLGEVFVVEQRYASDYLHGSISLVCSSSLSFISQWAKDPRIADLPLSRFAFLDTETTGLMGGTGVLPFLVGVGRFIERTICSETILHARPVGGTSHAGGAGGFPGAGRGPGYIQRQGFRCSHFEHTLCNEPHPGSHSRDTATSTCCPWPAGCGGTGSNRGP